MYRIVCIPISDVISDAIIYRKKRKNTKQVRSHYISKNKSISIKQCGRLINAWYMPDTDEPVNMSRLAAGRFCGILAVIICSFDAQHQISYCTYWLEHSEHYPIQTANDGWRTTSRRRQRRWRREQD